jgi:hypothetical protein
VPVILRALAAALAAGVALVSVAAPAGATFPGRNGNIFWTSQTSPGGYVIADLTEFDPRTARERRLWECESGAPDLAQACTGVSAPAASPDGRVAVVWTRDSFRSPGPPPTGILRTFAADGESAHDVEVTGARTFSHDTERRTLRFLNDGLTLSGQHYEGEYTGPQVVHRIGLDGVARAQVGPRGASDFDWSVDGRAAFVRHGNLWVLERDGTQRRLTARGGVQPSWSPRGRWIVFSRAHDLFAIDSRGGPPRRHTRRGGDWPSWSPDGRRIAFLRWKPKRRDQIAWSGVAYLYVLDFRSGRTAQLRADPLYDIGGTYSTSPPEWQALPR